MGEVWVCRSRRSCRCRGCRTPLQSSASRSGCDKPNGARTRSQWGRSWHTIIIITYWLLGAGSPPCGARRAADVMVDYWAERSSGIVHHARVVHPPFAWVGLVKRTHTDAPGSPARTFGGGCGGGFIWAQRNAHIQAGRALRTPSGYSSALGELSRGIGPRLVRN